MASFFSAFPRRLFDKVVPSTSWASIIAALPVVIWTHDSFYTLCRVRGSSMNPTLQDGDIVLVRRSDHIWQKQLKEFLGGSVRTTNKIDEDTDDGDNNNNNQKEEEFQKKQQMERLKVKEFEKIHCSQTEPIWLVRKPPIAATGDIVVFRDPTEYPARWNIKRAIGLGGQVVMMPSARFDKPSSSSSGGNGAPRYRMDAGDVDRTMRIVTPSVPPYSIWVEGDNTANSVDSKNHGPISKKLMMGIAEYVVWPPSRMGTSLKNNSGNHINPSRQPRAYWP